MRLSFRQIAAFREVVAAGSITAAAHRLHLTQPAVSRLIASLEAEIGLRLFERVRQRVLVTHEGRLLYSEIDKAFIGLDKIAARAVEIRELRTGAIKLAAMPALSFAVIPSVMTKFRGAFPDVVLSLQIRSSEKVFEWLSGQQFDLGLAALPTNKTISDIELLEAPPCMCIVPRSSDLEARAVLRPTDLRGLPFISLGPDSMLRKHVDSAFQAAGVPRRMVLETPMSLSALQFAERGIGVTIIDPFTAMAFSGGPVVAKPFEPVIPYEFGALFPAYLPRSGLALKFLDYVRDGIDRLRQSVDDARRRPHKLEA